MMGDSFAGKLGYIVPEQLGFSGAEVGPWTDLYSLALAGMTFAAGKPLDMGNTVGRAEEARRGVIDLSALPGDSRPVFEKLLNYDSSERPKSASEVLQFFEGNAETWTATLVPVTIAHERRRAEDIFHGERSWWQIARSQAFLALVPLAALGLAGGGYLVLGGSKTS